MPASRKDVAAAEKIFGPSLACLKGKTTRRKTDRAEVERVDLPPELLKEHRDVILAIDIFYVNKLPFLFTKSRGIQFYTAQRLANRKVKTVRSKLGAIIQLYHKRGFHVSDVVADIEFEPLRDAVAKAGCHLDVVAKGVHVPDGERGIRTVKERCRSVFSQMAHKSVPSIVINGIVQHVCFWLNSVPPKNGISDTISPRSIVTGKETDFKLHARVRFGQYVQTHEEHSNDMNERTIGAIALNTMGNSTGGVYFLNLASGKQIHRQHWTELPACHQE